jgi:hypothetical protein
MTSRLAYLHGNSVFRIYVARSSVLQPIDRRGRTILDRVGRNFVTGRGGRRRVGSQNTVDELVLKGEGGVHARPKLVTTSSSGICSSESWTLAPSILGRAHKFVHAHGVGSGVMMMSVRHFFLGGFEAGEW